TALRVQFLEPCAGGLGMVHVALLGLDSEAATRERRASATSVTVLTGGCAVDVGVRRQYDIRGAAFLFVCVVLRGGQGLPVGSGQLRTEVRLAGLVSAFLGDAGRFLLTLLLDVERLHGGAVRLVHVGIRLERVPHRGVRLVGVTARGAAVGGAVVLQVGRTDGAAAQSFRQVRYLATMDRSSSDQAQHAANVHGEVSGFIAPNSVRKRIRALFLDVRADIIAHVVPPYRRRLTPVYVPVGAIYCVRVVSRRGSLSRFSCSSVAGGRYPRLSYPRPDI